jgi:ATP-dependent RNA helicase RhlE
VEEKLSFKNLNLIEPILKALISEGYSEPTPIQEQVIPVLLEGRDLVACSQTGTGKTAAFALPILQIISGENISTKVPRMIKALILTPTRELAAQIGDSFKVYGKNTPVKNCVIFGGVSQNAQVRALNFGVDVLIATPGRLIDLINQKLVTLEHIKVFVLDEADRMLDMGFVPDVKKIIAKLPQKRQTMLFSATMPSEISKLVDSILNNPIKISVTPVASTVEKIEQSVYFVEKKDKKLLLLQILKSQEITSALVFARTKHGADKIMKDILKAGITAQAIHGNKSQQARQLALNNFKNGKTRVLVATDIAARGIDVDELSHVINFELPNVPETYVHRIGRTGRAGNFGIAISFCDKEERKLLTDIQKLIGKKISVVEETSLSMSAQEMVETSVKNTEGIFVAKPNNRRSDRTVRSGTNGESNNRISNTRTGSTNRSGTNGKSNNRVTNTRTGSTTRGSTNFRSASGVR